MLVKVQPYGDLGFLGVNWAVAPSYSGVAIYRPTVYTDTYRIRWHYQWQVRPEAGWPTVLPGIGV